MEFTAEFPYCDIMVVAKCCVYEHRSYKQKGEEECKERET